MTDSQPPRQADPKEPGPDVPDGGEEHADATAPIPGSDSVATADTAGSSPSDSAAIDDAASVAIDAASAAIDDATSPSAAPEPPAGTPVTLEDLEGAVAPGGGHATLDLLYDLSLPVTVELGRASLKVEDVLALGQGSVIRLDRVAGDPVDVYVGAKKLAQAEVVVLDDQFGIRITHIYPDAGASEG